MKKITCVILAATTLAFVGCKTSSQYGRSTGEYIDDKTVTGNVKDALGDDSLTDAADIDVKTFRGSVHLTGFVDHPVQKQRASEITRKTQGVQYFKNDIVVKGQLPTQQRMSEAAGAQTQQQPMRSEFSAQEGTGTSAGWQPGAFNSLGEFRGEAAGAQTEAERELQEERQEQRQQQQTP